MAQSLRSARISSLRWRLQRTVCIAGLLGLALNGVVSYRQAQHEAEELMDGHLAQSARLLLALVRDNEGRLPELATRLAQAGRFMEHRSPRATCGRSRRASDHPAPWGFPRLRVRPRSPAN